MLRRHFLKSTAAVPALPLVACGSERVTAAAATPSPAETAPPFPLSEATIDDLQLQMQNGARTARSLTELYLARIEALDRRGPELRAVIELNPDALTIADEMDRERKAGKVRGPIHGIPVLIKDNIDTGDRMMTTAGSLAMEGHRAKADAFIVRRLRDAGAVILGKTNLSEWANFRSTRSTSGWSSRGGQTRNPYVLDRNPSGSSSGSAAAAAASLCAAAVGTETNGSITSPAACCGIVGLKPTVGLLSRTGIIPISATQDTAGPITRTVRDAAILLTAMSGADTADSATQAGDRKAAADYTAFLDKNALQGKRIGVEASHLSGHEAVVACFRAALDALTAAGATVVEIDLLPLFHSLGGAESTLLKYEFKDGLNRYLAAAGAPVKTLAEIIAFNKTHADRVMPWFQQELLEQSEAKGPLTDASFLSARERVRRTAGIIDEVFQKHSLHAIAGITTGPPHVTDPVNGDYGTGYYFCTPAAMAGCPHLTVPMGQVQGLPLGLSLMAQAWQDGPLLGMSYAYEQATKHRKPPGFLPQVK